MKYNRVYILCPSNHVTGGIEALFQLCDAINNLGVKSELILIPGGNMSVPDDYLGYNVSFCTDLINDGNTLVVAPEIWPHLLDSPLFSNAKKALWWLSVDNASNKTGPFREDLIHLCQSQYAINHLDEIGITNKFPLFDYLNNRFLVQQEPRKKENIVCYSIKGESAANRLSKMVNDAEFVMIKGMSGSQVFDLLSRSKVFIDFGNHPGKDRIPRESAILFNCVITNTDGAAAFNEDVPIPEGFKVSVTDLEKAASLISDCIANYNDNINKFDFYRKNILNQRDEFFEQVLLLLKGNSLNSHV